MLRVLQNLGHGGHLVLDTGLSLSRHGARLLHDVRLANSLKEYKTHLFWKIKEADSKAAY